MSDSKKSLKELADDAREQLRQEEASHKQEIDERTRAAYERNLREVRAEEERRNPKIDPAELKARQGTKELESYRQRQRELWLAHGGTGEEFEAAWPQMKRDYIQQESARAQGRVSSAY